MREAQQAGRDLEITTRDGQKHVFTAAEGWEAWNPQDRVLVPVLCVRRTGGEVEEFAMRDIVEVNVILPGDEFTALAQMLKEEMA